MYNKLRGACYLYARGLYIPFDFTSANLRSLNLSFKREPNYDFKELATLNRKNLTTSQENTHFHSEILRKVYTRWAAKTSWVD